MQELECRALDQAATLVLEANGWTGEIKVRPYVILRSGMAVTGEISKDGDLLPVDTIELINRHGHRLVELRYGKGHPRQRMTCAVTVSVAVVSKGLDV